MRLFLNIPLLLTAGLVLLSGGIRAVDGTPNPTGFNTRANSATLLLCGMDEVFAIDPSSAETGCIEKLWSWRAKDHAELPETVRDRFGTTDECKPVDGGKEILISSSGGA